MKRIAGIALAAILLALHLRAEEPPTPAPEPDQPSVTRAGDSSDFDYLLGDWEFTAVSKQWGRFKGRWSAVRLAEGQILDEYRVVDDEGGTIYVTTTLRNYDETRKQWDLVGSEPGSGLRDTGTAQRKGGEVHIEQTFGASSGTPSLWRIRYHSIHDDRFSWVAGRSTDGGVTWVEEFQTIEARRIGPPRQLPPLTRTVP